MFNSCHRFTDLINLPPRPQNGGHPALPDCVIQAGLEEKAGKFVVLIYFEILTCIEQFLLPARSLTCCAIRWGVDSNLLRFGSQGS